MSPRGRSVPVGGGNSGCAATARAARCGSTRAATAVALLSPREPRSGGWRRRDLLLALAVAAVARPRRAGAQPAALPVVGYVSVTAPREATANTASLRAGLAEVGFEEGKNVLIDHRSAFHQYDRLPALFAELVRLNVAVIVTGGNVAAVTARGVTRTIPIVFNVGADPVTLGLVASLAHPGGNATGLAVITERLTVKRLELMHELAPKGSTVGFLVNPDNESVLPEVMNAAQAMEQQLLVMKARSASDMEAAFQHFADARVGGIVVGNDAFFLSERERLVALAALHALPAVYEFLEYSASGGLMSYGPRLSDVYRQTGRYAGRILKGESPADLPVEQPTRFALVVNLKTARTLGLVLPPALLARADEVIE